MVTVPVDALRFSQENCSAKFRCGRLLPETIDAFVRGLDPRTQEWCVLNVIKRRGLLISNDNRRLYAMKEALRILREQDPAAMMWVRVRVYVWAPAFDTHLDHLAHRCGATDGRRIRVRPLKRHRAR
eukprot:UN1437